MNYDKNVDKCLKYVKMGYSGGGGGGLNLQYDPNHSLCCKSMRLLSELDMTYTFHIPPADKLYSPPGGHFRQIQHGRHLKDGLP